ncbi:MAG: hypothetical protein QXY80_02315 [Candidatus Jordarchaeales archaeon]
MSHYREVVRHTHGCPHDEWYRSIPDAGTVLETGDCLVGSAATSIDIAVGTMIAVHLGSHHA